jgi:tetratricopeptide (TPR) repeat protein
MDGVSQRHQAVLEELTEWWMDLCTRGTGSRVVLVEVPQGWGRSTLLREFAAIVEADDAPVTVVVRIDGESLRVLPGGPGTRARVLTEVLAGAGRHHRVAELAGVDRPAGAIQLGLGVGGLFATPLATAAAMVLGTVVVGAAGKVFDDSPAGQDGALARAARSVAALSARVPVVVLIDDIDALGRDLAVMLADNLTSRPDGQVLLVATTDPPPSGSDHGDTLFKELVSRYWLASRVARAEADPDMGYQSRADLAAQLCPALPGPAVRRIAQRTATFTDVFAVTSARRLRDAEHAADESAALTVVDAVIDAAMGSKPVSSLAAVLAWAGGVMHARQTDAALAILGQDYQDVDPDVIRTGTLARLADPASPRPPVASGALAAADRQQMAEALVAIALDLGADPQAGLIDRLVAAQAAYRVRSDLPAPDMLLSVARILVAALEGLGDLDAAYQAAAAAMAESTPGQNHGERRFLSAAVLRLARKLPAHHDDPLVADMIKSATEGGAVTGLERRLWAAVDLLDMPAKREAALGLAEEVAAALGARHDLGAEASQWRRAAAFHAGQHGYPALAQQLLAPELTATDQGRQNAAQAILYAIGGPNADTRLQIIACESQLATTPGTAEDDLLRLHHTLAADYAVVGDYRHALMHALKELPLREHLQGRDHVDTLVARGIIAEYTGRSGDLADALRLFGEVLPDLVRVLGRSHPHTLVTRSNIALYTGRSGDLADALRLFEEVLPDLVRVLGPDHLDTLATRNNEALYTAESGDLVGALHLLQELLPDLVRVLGPVHPGTLAARSNLATWIDKVGDPREALRLSEDLLADKTRVLGPDHPDTLATRSNIAICTGKLGDPEEALRLLEELLPDVARALGPDHPATLSVRNNIAVWTGESGDLGKALRLLKQLLADRNRVLGRDHPDTLNTRYSIAACTLSSGDPVRALQLFEDLLQDQIRVLGPNHPDTLNTREKIAQCTSQDR